MNSRYPAGPLARKWESYQVQTKLINHREQAEIQNHIVECGARWLVCRPATLAELGYEVHNFVFHDSARRAHSVAAQGGINAAKN